MKKLTILLFFLSLNISSCSNSKIDPTYPENPDIVRKTRGGRFFNDPVTIYGNNKKFDEKTKQVTIDNKKPLWLASVDVIGGLFPIAIIDNDSGIIVTEWYQNGDNKNARIKINAVVKNNEIKEENLTISIFNQEKDKKGLWNDKKIDNNIVVKLIKEKIIEKAKQASTSK